MTAVLVAGVVGSPISGALLSVHGFGLAGWQWLFLLEGLPAIVLGLVVLRVLADRPGDARWLDAVERSTLEACLEEDALAGLREQHTVVDAIANPRTWLLAIVYFTIPLTSYGLGFWLPQMIKTATGANNFTVGLLTAIPYAAGAIAMVVAGRHSDRTGERRWHVAIAAVVSATGVALSAFGGGAVWAIAMLSLATIGYASMFGPFWALATSHARGVGAAASIALINSIGNTGGFVGPFLLGSIDDATHSFAAGLYVIAMLMAVGGSLALAVRE